MYFDDGDENFFGFNSDEVTELSYFKFLCNLESLQGVRKGPFKNDVTQNFSTLTYCNPWYGDMSMCIRGFQYVNFQKFCVA